jgi:hypothetical protein
MLVRDRESQLEVSLLVSVNDISQHYFGTE